MKIKFICKQCKKEVFDYRTNKAKFCSKKCFYKYQRNSNHPMFGKTLTKENRIKISLANKKRFLNIKNHPMFGKHHTKLSRKKISEGNKGRISPRKGIKLSKSLRKKLSIAHLGQISWSKGKTFSKSYRNKLSKSHIGIQTGENHPNWLGGKSFEPYSVDWTETLKRSIRERDNYICQLCNQYGNEVHHINYDKKNCNPINLITLCPKCHRKTNFHRNYWIFKLLSEGGL